MSANRTLDWEAAKKRLSELDAALDHSLIPSGADIERVYQSRAAFLAQIQQRPEIENTERILVFRVGSSRFGVPLGEVAEVITSPKIASVPGADENVAGLLQVRGEVRPVWNLRAVLGLPADQNAVENAGHVILLRNGSREIGILAENLEDIVSSVERQPAPATSLRGSWLTPDFVTVLNTETLVEKLQD